MLGRDSNLYDLTLFVIQGPQPHHYTYYNVSALLFFVFFCLCCPCCPCVCLFTEVMQHFGLQKSISYLYKGEFIFKTESKCVCINKWPVKIIKYNYFCNNAEGTPHAEKSPMVRSVTTKEQCSCKTSCVLVRGSISS